MIAGGGGGVDGARGGCGGACDGACGGGCTFNGGNRGNGAHSLPNLSLASHKRSARSTSGSALRRSSKSTAPRLTLQKQSRESNSRSLTQHSFRSNVASEFASHADTSASSRSAAHSATNVSDACARARLALESATTTTHRNGIATAFRTIATTSWSAEGKTRRRRRPRIYENLLTRASTFSNRCLSSCILRLASRAFKVYSGNLSIVAFAPSMVSTHAVASSASLIFCAILS